MAAFQNAVLVIVGVATVHDGFGSKF